MIWLERGKNVGKGRVRAVHSHRAPTGTKWKFASVPLPKELTSKRTGTPEMQRMWHSCLTKDCKDGKVSTSNSRNVWSSYCQAKSNKQNRTEHSLWRGRFWRASTETFRMLAFWLCQLRGLGRAKENERGKGGEGQKWYFLTSPPSQSTPDPLVFKNPLKMAAGSQSISARASCRKYACSAGWTERRWAELSSRCDLYRDNGAEWPDEMALTSNFSSQVFVKVNRSLTASFTLCLADSGSETGIRTSGRQDTGIHGRRVRRDDRMNWAFSADLHYEATWQPIGLAALFTLLCNSVKPNDEKSGHSERTNYFA